MFLKMPFYLVCDEGSSMTGAPIDAVNEGLKGLFRAISSNPVIDNKALVCVIAFSDTAEVLVPLQSASDTPTFPSCTAAVAGSSYKAAFTALCSAIDADCARIRADGFRLERPVVFFMSCGRPEPEDWQSVHADLVSRDNRYRPHIISFAVGGADPEVIRHVATDVDRAGGTRFAYMASEGTDPGSALAEIMRMWSEPLGSHESDQVEIPPIPPESGNMMIDTDPTDARAMTRPLLEWRFATERPPTLTQPPKPNRHQIEW
jgi:uncharacterized protein YegL